MNKDAYIAAHEALVEEYLEAHPEADWSEAYERVADAAYARMQDNYWDRVDYYRQLRKDEG